MKNGVYRPRMEEDPFPSYGDRVPLSGYIKLYPMREEFLVRTTSQQPVLISIFAGTKFDEYSGVSKLIDMELVYNILPIICCDHICYAILSLLSCL